jgi:hypothetical protein
MIYAAMTPGRHNNWGWVGSSVNSERSLALLATKVRAPKYEEFRSFVVDVEQAESEPLLLVRR